MTISTTVCKTIVLADGIASTWDYDFYIPTGSGYQLTMVTTAGVLSVIDPSDYTVNNVGDPNGGTFHYLPGSGPVSAGYFLCLLREVPNQQLTSLGNQNANQWATTEAALDWIVMQIQQLQERVDQCIQGPAAAGSNMTILQVASLRANKTMKFDADGQPYAG